MAIEHKRLSRAVAFACLVAGLLLATAPVALADTELGHKGTVGIHSLVDSASSPGATCKYKYLSKYDYGKLKRIFVQPPRMRAVAGMNAQTVGWKFTVQRRIISIVGATRWKKTYTSPQMKAVTDDAHNAAFNTASVAVRVPFGPEAQDAFAIYRVTVKMFWHRGNGSVQGKARHRVEFYRSVFDTGGSGLQENTCGDYWSPTW